MNILLEALKKTFIKDTEDIKNPSNETRPENIAAELSNEYQGITAFTGEDSELDLGGYNTISPTVYQNKVIRKYRELLSSSDVDYAVDLIINEMIFSLDEDVLVLSTSDNISNKVRDKLTEKFNKIKKVINMKENLYLICRQLYIDGQINLALTYDKSNLKDGIKEFKILEPFNLIFNKEKQIWTYIESDVEDLYNDNEFDETYSKDELLHIDFKLYKNIAIGRDKYAKINYGYLENAIKYVNQLNTLESLLVPSRYTRSVSRRLFNVDVAELPPKKAKELMDKIRSDFKYKKTYDINNGNIKNINATQPIVEDYWLSNRNGGRGTTVELMDEKGSVMDLDDIIYISKKLFTSLKIPANRNPYLDESSDFGYDDNNISNEDMSFYLFIDKLRQPVSNLIKRVLKRELIYSGDMTDQEWLKIDQDIDIEFSNRSIFLENMRKDLFFKSIGNLQDIKEEIGSIISLDSAVNTTLGWTSDKLEEELDKIREEKTNSKFNNFYSKEDY